MQVRQFRTFHHAVRCLWRHGASLSAILISAHLSQASAQNTTTPPPANVTASTDALKQREQELEAARTEQKNAADTQAKLKAEIAAIGEDRGKLNQQLIDISTQVRDVEGRVTDPWGGVRVGYTASGKINRKDFGLNWNAALETGGVVVGDEVRIELNVEAVLK